MYSLMISGKRNNRIETWTQTSLGEESGKEGHGTRRYRLTLDSNVLSSLCFSNPILTFV